MYETYTKESSAFLFLMILALVGHLEMCLARNVLHCFHVASIVAYVDNGDFKKEKHLVYIYSLSKLFGKSVNMLSIMSASFLNKI